MLKNVNEIKNHFPITKNGHYFSSASIAGMHDDVIKSHHEWIDFMAQQGGMNDHRYFEVLEQARASAAQYIGCSKEEVAFVSNSSYAFNMMSMLLFQRTTKKKVLIPAQEFPTTYLPWEYQGYEVQPIHSDKNRLCVEDFLRAIDEDTAAVACSGINSFNGQRLPLRELGKALRQRSVFLFVNHTQQAGVFDLDWDEAFITGMCFSTHKRFAACMGTSIFALRKSFYDGLDWPLMGWTSVEDPWEMRNFQTTARNDLSALELGSMPFNNLLAIHTAIELQNKIGMKAISEHIIEMTEYLIQKLSQLPVDILTPHDSKDDLSGIVSFTPGEADVERLVAELAKAQIYVNQRKTFIRASVYIYTTKEDIDALVHALSTHLKH